MHAAPRAVQDSRSSLSAKFTPAHRLLRENGFGHVIHAKSIADVNFKIFFSHNSLSNARLGIIVAKKIFPGATDRNRIKRIIRDTFRQHSVKLHNLDLVVMVRRTCAQENNTYVCSLRTLFSRIENRCAEL